MSHETVGRVSPRHSPQSRHTPFHRRHSVAPCSDVAGHRLCPRGEEPRRSRPGRFAVPGWPDGCPGSPDEHCPWRPHRGRQGGSAAVSDRDLDRAAAAASATNALGMDAGRCPSPGSRRLRNPTGVSLRLQATQSGHYVQLRTLPVQLRTPDPPHGFCHSSVPAVGRLVDLSGTALALQHQPRQAEGVPLRRTSLTATRLLTAGVRRPVR